MHTTTRFPTVLLLSWCCLLLGGANTPLGAQDAAVSTPLPASERLFQNIFPVSSHIGPGASSARLASAPIAAAETREETSGAQTSPPPHAFSSLYVGLITAQALDVHSTIRALDAGHKEANPLMRWATDSPITLVAFKTAATAGTMYIIERVRKKHPKRALVLLGVIDSAYVFVVAHNYRVPVRTR